MASTDAKPIPQKNVAYRITFPIFDADGDLVTGATGLDSEISKDGGTFTDCTNEATEIATSSGMYYLDLTSTEMNADTVAIIVKTTSSGAKTTPIVMYPEEAGDIRVNVTQFGGSNGTFASGRPEVNTTHAGGTAWGSGAITAGAIADGAIDRATFAADTGLQTARSNTAQAGASGSITLDASASSTTDFYVGMLVLITGGTGVGQVRRITAYNGTSKVATVERNWATNPDNTSTFALLASSGAKVDSSLRTTDINSANLDATVSSRASQTSLDTLDDYVDTEVAAIKTKTDQLTFTTANRVDSTVVDKTGFALSSAGIQAIWDALSSALTTAGSIGKRLVDYLTGDIYARLGAPAGASVSADIAAVNAKTTNLPSDPADASDIASSFSTVNTKLDTIDDFLDTEIAAILADTNELQTDWVNGGRLDLLIDAIKAKTDNIPASPASTGDIPTASAIADAVWDELSTGHTDAGKAGQQLWTDIDAVKAKTDNLPSDPADESSIQAAIASLNDISASDVLTQVNAALDASGSELTAIPTTTGTLRQKINFLFQYFRNKKTQTSTTETLFKEDASTSLGTATLSDNGTTATKGEMN